jgi:prepilin-type N-terminal cleavage/methylation domain-containing protein
MTFMKKRDGFTLVELLVVIGVAGVLLALGGTIATKFVARHSTDTVTRTVSSTLQLTKLKSSRQGLEYRAIFAKCSNLDATDPKCPKCSTYVDYKSGDDTLTISTERGNSNSKSTTWCNESSQTINIQGLTLSLTVPSNPYRYSFNPDGTLGPDNGTVNINPADGGGGKRCGQVVANPLGRIRIVEGTWNSSSNTCSPVY